MLPALAWNAAQPMNKNTALKRLNDWSRQGRYVFTVADLAKIFLEDNPRTLHASLQRLVADGLLERPVRGVYLYALSPQRGDTHTLEHIARALRRGAYNYVSLESALSEHGAISQIPMGRLTVMTTGRRGTYKTPYGTIEFIHTRRKPAELLAGMRDVGRPLRLATAQTAWRDLKRVGRNTQLVDVAELNHG
jgi:predicted transcriptional regulator of viral defense system